MPKFKFSIKIVWFYYAHYKLNYSIAVNALRNIAMTDKVCLVVVGVSTFYRPDLSCLC